LFIGVKFKRMYIFKGVNPSVLSFILLVFNR
jgi:hypothetical protein